MTPTSNQQTNQPQVSTQLLQDIKNLQSKTGEISNNAALQLIMTTLITISTKVDKIADDFECNMEETKDFQNTLASRVDNLAISVENLTKELQINKQQLSEISRSAENWCMPNPLVTFGCFIKTHPKLFLGLITVGMFLLFMLNIPTVKHSFVMFVGFPEEFADFVAPIITK